MVPVQDRVKLIHSESEWLKEYLNSLPPDAWGRPSACDRWTVADVVAHLTWVAEFYVDTISRGVRGDASSPKDRPPGDFTGATSFDEYIAQRAIALRESLGDQLLTTFSAQYDGLNQLMAGLSPQDWEKPCSAGRLQNIPAQGFISLSAQECAIHGWDIRSRLESTAPLSAESLPVLMEWIPARFRLPGYADFPTGPRLPSAIRYRFELTGVAPSKRDIIVDKGKACMEPAGTAVADVTFRGDADAFVLLMYRRLTLEQTIAAGQLAVQGKRRLISAFDRWLKGV